MIGATQKRERGPRLADDDSALVALFIIGVLLVATFGGLIAWAAISLVVT